MFGFETVAIGLILLAAQASADLCAGRKDGQHLPNPADCSSFFVCNFGQSKQFECPGGLLYDHSKRACNWANVVNCDRNTEVPITFSPPSDAPTTVISQTEQPEEHSIETQAPTSPAVAPGPISTVAPGPVRPTIPDYITAKPDIVITSPQPEYNKTVAPGIIEIQKNIFHCMDPEFYFAPHPRNCEMYFICENYRIHPQECGEGVLWDYINNRCDFPIAAVCYTGSVPTKHFAKMVCSSGGRTIEYKQDECKYVSTTSPVKPGNHTICPESQAFIPHEDDCRKYYICIERMPIATSCPEYTAWDKNLSQCNEESWKHCIG